jgi:ABC-type bacteriocin/lantibiotic exporter with double-glycine peptidase domain
MPSTRFSILDFWVIFNFRRQIRYHVLMTAKSNSPTFGILPFGVSFTQTEIYITLNKSNVVTVILRMRLLYSYARQYWKLIILALFLATVNQTFSLLDPLIFRHIIDNYVTKFKEYTGQEFFRGAGLLLAAAVGVAFVSRVAKNFQDYYINVITQKLGVQMYTDGIRHSLELPFEVFEDQRSCETLGKLEKGRIVETGNHQRLLDLKGLYFAMWRQQVGEGQNGRFVEQMQAVAMQHGGVGGRSQGITICLFFVFQKRILYDGGRFHGY